VSDRHVVGGMLVVLGVVALAEGWRLYALRTDMVAGAVVGDDTFPLLVGAAMIVFGAAAMRVRLRSVRLPPPDRDTRHRMRTSAVVIALYWASVPWLGYTVATGLAAIALFRAMGRYRWGVAAIGGIIVTTALYLLFRVWLLQPLPGGWFGL
jgi:hypothetical protein